MPSINRARNNLTAQTGNRLSCRPCINEKTASLTLSRTTCPKAFPYFLKTVFNRKRGPVPGYAPNYSRLDERRTGLPSRINNR